MDRDDMRERLYLRIDHILYDAGFFAEPSTLKAIMQEIDRYVADSLNTGNE